jgi:hypothetical protein
MSSEAPVPKPSSGRRALLVNLTLAVAVAAGVAVTVIARSSPPPQVQPEPGNSAPAVQNAEGELPPPPQVPPELGNIAPALQDAAGELNRGMREATGALNDLSRSMQDAGSAAARFVEYLRAERWHEAYQSTSHAFQQKLDEASFVRFVKEGPPLNTPDTSINFNFGFGTPGTSITSSGVAPKGGVWVGLVSEQGAVKVDRMALGDRTAP